MKLIKPLIIASTLLTTLPAFALPSVTAELPKEGPKAECSKRGFDSKFKLTDEQREKLGTLRDQFKLSTATQKAELEVSFHQMRTLLSKPTIDKQAVLALQTKINGLKDNLANARVAMMLSASDVFTPEQRAEFSKMHGMRGGKHHRGGHFEGRGGRHEGREGSKIG